MASKSVKHKSNAVRKEVSYNLLLLIEGLSCSLCAWWNGAGGMERLEGVGRGSSFARRGERSEREGTRLVETLRGEVAPRRTLPKPNFTGQFLSRRCPAVSPVNAGRD